MRFEPKKIASQIASPTVSDAFLVENLVYKTVQIVGSGNVLFEGTIDGSTWAPLLGGNVAGPAILTIEESVKSLRVTAVGAGPFDVWVSGYNERTE